MLQVGDKQKVKVNDIVRHVSYENIGVVTKVLNADAWVTLDSGLDITPNVSRLTIIGKVKKWKNR